MSATIQPSSQGKIWILEDDEQICRILKTILAPYSSEFFHYLADFANAWKNVASRPAVLLADLALPDGSFLNWMAESSGFSKGPTRCLVISGTQDIVPMRASMEMGASDYIVKPFVSAEVQVKVERILKTQQMPILLDPTTLTAIFKGHTMALTSKQFQILSILCARHPEGISGFDIQTSIWQNTKVNQKNLTVHLSLLRTKLKEIGVNISFQNSSYFLQFR